MKKVAVVALKGGVGKSSIAAGLGLALVASSQKVGFLDIDITGSNLYSALGLEKSPKWKLDSVNERVIVPEVNGYWLLSIASFVGEEYAVLWEKSHESELMDARNKIAALSLGSTIESLESIRRQIDNILASSKWRFVKELLSPEIVTWPEPLDFLIADLPPSTSNEMFSFFEQVKDLFGVVIVSQPARISTIGLVRTIDLLRQKQIPIIGLVENMAMVRCPHCDETIYPFLSKEVDLEEICRNSKIPFLCSIPLSNDAKELKPIFNKLAACVSEAEPVVLKEVTNLRRLKRRVVKSIGRRF